MLGQMMNAPLTITSILRYAERVFRDTEIVSVTADNPATVIPSAMPSGAPAA